MNIENYQWGTWRQSNNYTYYLPEEINHPWKWDNTSLRPSTPFWTATAGSDGC